MSVSAVTNLGATSYTSAPTITYNCTVNNAVVSTNLRIRNGPGTSYTELGLHNRLGSSYGNQYWNVHELFNTNGQIWAREWFSNQWGWSIFLLNGEYYSNISPWPNTTYGQFRVSGITCTATRESSNSPTVNVSMAVSWHCASGTIENYHNWNVYAYAHIPTGGEALAYIHWQSTVIGAGSGTVYINYSFTETSGNSTIYGGNYGIWGSAVNNKFGNAPSTGIGQGYTINIPPYVSYINVVKQFNGSTWEDVPILSKDNEVLDVYQNINGVWEKLT